jgi:Kdo2-lipid IVA lauroyltransferase/acyltransferase
LIGWQHRDEEAGMLVQKAIDYAVYLAARMVLCLVQMTSLERCERFCSLLAKVLSSKIPFRKKLIDNNLKHVFPNWSEQELENTRYEMWRYLLLMVCEIAQAHRKIRRTNWYQFFAIKDRRQFMVSIFDPRPNILVSGHFGNFELAGHLMGVFGVRINTIARPLDNPYMDAYFNQLRCSGNQQFLPKDGSAVEIQKVLESGGTLALLADQHAGAKGCWVNFLGRPACCHKALALFTLSSGAPMLVFYNRRLNKPMQFEMAYTGNADPKIPGPHLAGVQQLTQWYNDRLEDFVRLSPEQYWWLHNRWREAPPRLLKQMSRAA